jgi:hypothetical protein
MRYSGTFAQAEWSKNMNVNKAARSRKTKATERVRKGILDFIWEMNGAQGTGKKVTMTNRRRQALRLLRHLDGSSR